MNIIIHEGNKSEDLLLKEGSIPDASSTENDDFKIFQTIIKFQL